jgi:AcrR family transcriptional regulator
MTTLTSWRGRAAILDAAHAVFARKGYAAAGIADLASELGIGPG